jgi:molybdate transport system substrate-binding protein
VRKLIVGILAILFAAPATGGEEILVFAAASLTESLEEIAKSFETRTGAVVRFSFGASSDLARQIEAGAPADVFFSADTAKMDTLERAGSVRREDRREFLSNQLVVVVPADSKVEVSKPEDLAKLPRLALADPGAVPAGIYAKRWLESAGLWREIEPRIVPSLDVRAALAAVESGAVPAGIVYRTDAAVSRRTRVAYVVESGPDIIYSVAALARSRGKAAKTFVQFLQSDAGRAVFVRRGFRIRGGAVG